MSMTRNRRGLWRHGIGVAACLALPARAPAEQGGITMSVDVDVTDAPRKLLKAKLHIPAKAGPLTLYYPKWIPGEHGPTGPITDLAGVKISARASPSPRARDEVEMLRCIVRCPRRNGRGRIAAFPGAAVALGFQCRRTYHRQAVRSTGIRLCFTPRASRHGTSSAKRASSIRQSGKSAPRSRSPSTRIISSSFAGVAGNAGRFAGFVRLLFE